MKDVDRSSEQERNMVRCAVMRETRTVRERGKAERAGRARELVLIKRRPCTPPVQFESDQQDEPTISISTDTEDRAWWRSYLDLLVKLLLDDLALKLLGGCDESGIGLEEETAESAPSFVRAVLELGKGHARSTRRLSGRRRREARSQRGRPSCPSHSDP